MKNENISKLVSVAFLVTLFLPIFLVFGHLEAHSKHDVCQDFSGETHVHTIDLNCELDEIQFNAQFTFDVLNVINPISFFSEKYFEIKIERIYTVQETYFSLRAPPLVV